MADDPIPDRGPSTPSDGIPDRGPSTPSDGIPEWEAPSTPPDEATFDSDPPVPVDELIPDSDPPVPVDDPSGPPGVPATMPRDSAGSPVAGRSVFAEVDRSFRRAVRADVLRQQVQDDWECVMQYAHPKKGHAAVAALASLTELDRNDLDFVRRVRNQIAHNKGDQVRETDLRRAAWVVSVALQRLEPSEADSS